MAKDTESWDVETPHRAVGFLKQAPRPALFPSPRWKPLKGATVYAEVSGDSYYRVFIARGDSAGQMSIERHSERYFRTRLKRIRKKGGETGHEQIHGWDVLTYGCSSGCAFMWKYGGYTFTAGGYYGPNGNDPDAATEDLRAIIASLRVLPPKHGG